MSKSSAQLEREAEETRAELAATLAELRTRLTPGQLLDEAVGYAREGMVGEFFGNLRRQVGRNPVPATMAGLGLAWLMVSAGRAPRPSSFDTTDEWDSGAREMAARGASSAAGSARHSMHDMREGVAGMAESASDTARSAANRLSEKAKAAGAAFGDMASEAQSRMSSAYDRASHGVSGAASSGRSFVDFCREQPLVLAGIGMALGAALGAAFPATEAENKLMGEKSDKLKERMGDVAAQQYEKAEEVVAGTYEHAKKEAARQFGGKEEMPAVSETVSMAPSDMSNPIPASDEAAVRQEELWQPRPTR